MTQRSKNSASAISPPSLPSAEDLRPWDGAELKNGDVVLAVKGDRVSSLAAFYRKVWSLGDAGASVPLTLYREGVTFDVSVNSSDRAKFLKAPRVH